MNLSAKLILLLFGIVFENGFGQVHENDSNAKEIQTTKSTLIQEEILEVGSKSKQKCQDYGKYGYDKTTETSISPNQVGKCQPFLQDAIEDDGIHAHPKEYPHMALIGYETENSTISWMCSGTLISEKYVLSVAHCAFHRLYLEPKYILLGEFELDSSADDARPQQIAIKNIIVHPNYKSSMVYHDIALFQLEHDAVLNPYVRPACLNTNPNLTITRGVATGWGKISPYSSGLDKKMQKVTLDVFTNTECNDVYRKNIGRRLTNGIVEETQLCAGTRDGSAKTCLGSGGPFQIQDLEKNYCASKIVGISTFGKTCENIAGIPGVYTKVSAYIQWIEEIVWP